MISCDDYFQLLQQHGFHYFAGVPDSLLKDLCAYITDHVPVGNHIIPANEGAAVALATGHYLATGKPGVVYLQNSGLGNTVNPLVSLADPDIYAIPMLLLIGWRGEPGVKDEPQHLKQGRITLDLLQTLGMPYEVLPELLPEASATLERAVATMTRQSCPYALVIRKGTFDPYTPRSRAIPCQNLQLTREAALIAVLENLEPAAVIISTTGMASREVFEYRARSGQGHHRDFLTVGSMGHASQIALGIAQAESQRPVCCLDGDGAVLMHLGSLAIIGSERAANLRHIIINNGAHDSVGGQPTAGFSVDFPALAKACGYLSAATATTAREVAVSLRKMQSQPGPALLEIRVRCGARSDLGRPTTSPLENRREFMSFLQADLPPPHSL